MYLDLSKWKAILTLLMGIGGWYLNFLKIYKHQLSALDIDIEPLLLKIRPELNDKWVISLQKLYTLTYYNLPTVKDIWLQTFRVLWSKPRYIPDRISWTQNAAMLLTSLVQIDKDWRFPKM